MPTQAEYGEHVGITRQAAAETLKKLTLKKGASLDEFRIAYCQHLRDVAAGRRSESGGEQYDLTEERARLAKEQADKTAMENAKLRGELIETDHAHTVWGGIVQKIRARMLSLPTKAAPLLVGQKRASEAQAVLEEFIHETLLDLANPTLYDDRTRKKNRR